MTVAFITPHSVITNPDTIKALAPATRDAHKHVRDAGYGDFIFAYDVQMGRALFITNPWDNPHLEEMRYRGEDLGGWGKR